MARIRASKQEKLDDVSIKEVISLMEQEKPITKKEACSKLNISYNTKRLDSIIKEFKERKDREATLRKNLRGKPLSFEEKKEIIEGALNGTPITDISKSTYRSLKVIKDLLIAYSIPLKTREKGDYFKNVPLVDESAICANYETGSLVYSARYHCIAEISSLFSDSDKHGKVYRIWLLGGEQQYAYQPYYELIDLSKVQKEFNIEIQHKTGVMARPLRIE